MKESFDNKSTNLKGYFTLKNSSKKSVVICKCGRCGVVLPQKEMIRDDCSDTGWICPECDSDLYPDFESNEF